MTTPNRELYLSAVSYKSAVDDSTGETQYFVEGYASTGDIDLVNDCVTPACFESMDTQLKGRVIMCDLDHESFDPKNPRMNLMPIAKIVDSRVDAKGLWVRAQLNKNAARFKSVWGSVKDGFYNAFSITYKAVKAAYKNIDGKSVRLLDDVLLLNIALTGNPINPQARITGVVAKSFQLAMEDIPMEEETKSDAPTAPVEVVVEAPAEPAAPAVDPIIALTNSVAALSERVAAFEAKSVITEPVVEPEVKAQLSAMEARVATLEAEKKALEETLHKPLFKGAQVKSQPQADNASARPNIIAFC